MRTKHIGVIFLILFVVFLIISMALGIDSEYSGGTIFFAFVFLGLGIFIVFQSEKDAEVILKQKLSSSLKNIEGFTVTQSFSSKDYKGLIAIDEGNQKICFLEYDTNKIKFDTDEVKRYKVLSNIYNYRDILEVEVIEDGERCLSR